jgi:hypothetical protein
MDQRFKPRLEWQIGEANREFSINVPAEDRDLMMEICNEMGVTLEELYARGIKMGQFISEGLRNKTIEAVLVYNKDSSEIYTVPVPNPIYRLKDFGR